ncbi:MAG: hypothetical protein U9Q72_02430 [Patescibacteria group bacterium]|nr:hypothetical protein [Patescibacteria group bacterium]
MDNYKSNAGPNTSETDEINAERRQARITRENLIRNYSSRRDNLKADLDRRDTENADLENKIRLAKKVIADRTNDILQLEKKLKRFNKELKRDKFELRQDKDRIFKINKEVKFFQGELMAAEKKLKKVTIEGRDN